MSRRAVAFLGLLIGFTTILGCQRASRYPAAGAVKPAPREEKIGSAEFAWAWYLPDGWKPRLDTPIVFIADGHSEWSNLHAFWNDFPPPAAGMRTVHLGQFPLGMAGALVMADRLKAVKIKVPLGLPDPTPQLPSANPPTSAKWELGRQIFFDRKLRAGGDTFACASCHDPQRGFGEDRGVTLGGDRNTLSLINCVYNRHQFWDGRATALEEVMVRTLDDELLPDDKQPKRWPQENHRWGGLVRALGADIDYRLKFEQVFGTLPTQDSIAKALATYLRTILSGNSLVDRAEHERRRQKASQLQVEHFTALLDDKTLNDLRLDKQAKDGAAQKLIHGERLFRTKGCVTCHPGPLFTDHDFHNIGIGESERYQQPGAETGRFAFVPIGLKEARLVGAFKTPTLRALPRTAPYFHDGTAPDLRRVVEYFNHSVHSYRYYLAEPLRAHAEGLAKMLDMSADDQDALVLFLQALDGDPVDGIVAATPKEKN